MRIGIIGAGHAGVSAAQEAIKHGAEVTLFSEEKFLPYYRPRITSVAFLQSGENDIFMHQQVEWYSDNRIKLVLGTKIVLINTDEKSLTSELGESYVFDKIVIATGAKPIVPPFTKALIQKGKVSPLWTMQDALTIRGKTASIKNIAIIGGGVIGIESALRALDAGLNVSIIQKSPRLMASNLSPKASSTLNNILNEKGINLIMNTAIGEIQEKNTGVEIEASSKRIYADLVLLSIGGIPDTRIAGLPEPNLGRGIEVDFQTRTSSPNLFAAGDAALFKNIQTPCSALKAKEQGKSAGHNATTQDNSFIEYKPSAIAVEVKFKDFELHSIGDTEGDSNKKEEIIESAVKTYRSIIKNNDCIFGIQMVGSGKDFITYRKQLKEGFSRDYINNQNKQN